MSGAQRLRRARAGEPAARRAGRCSAGVLGVAGSVSCAVSMTVAAVGAGGSAAASGMAAMTGPAAGAPGGVLGDLVRAGPWLLAVSVLLVTAAFALTRRPVAAAPALLAGAVAYAGMYAQPSVAVMYASIAAGYITCAALVLWVRAGQGNDRRLWSRPHSLGSCVRSSGWPGGGGGSGAGEREGGE